METNIHPGTTATSASSNLAAKIIKIIAIVIYACCFIAGIMVGQEAESFLTILLFWVAGALSGTLMLGFSEVIRLLHEINQKVK